RIDAARMLKRRLKDAGLSDAFSPHSFRATGITNYLENGGTLEVAQRIAGHADSRTTKLYDRRGQKVLLEDKIWSGSIPLISSGTRRTTQEEELARLQRHHRWCCSFRC